jgi:AhpD family alkylhydroperoxidase
MGATSTGRAHINQSLEPTLTELVKLRASQINGCANCINMHAAEARENGETESASICCRPGERLLAIRTENAGFGVFADLAAIRSLQAKAAG